MSTCASHFTPPPLLLRKALSLSLYTLLVHSHCTLYILPCHCTPTIAVHCHCAATLSHVPLPPPPPLHMQSCIAGNVQDWTSLPWGTRSALWCKLARMLNLEGQASVRLQQIMEVLSDGVQELISLTVAEQLACQSPFQRSGLLRTRVSAPSFADQQMLTHHSRTRLQMDNTSSPTSVMERMQHRAQGHSFWRFYQRSVHGKRETEIEKAERVLNGPTKQVLVVVCGWGMVLSPGVDCRALAFEGTGGVRKPSMGVRLGEYRNRVRCNWMEGRGRPFPLVQISAVMVLSLGFAPKLWKTEERIAELWDQW